MSIQQRLAVLLAAMCIIIVPLTGLCAASDAPSAGGAPPAGGVPSAGAEHKPAPPTPPIAREPLTLEQALTIAFTRNPLVYESQQNLDAAHAAVTQARAARSPTADAQVTRTRISDVPSFGGVEFGLKEQTVGMLTVAQPLYTGGKIEAGIRASQAGSVAAAEALTRTYQTVTNDVRRAYYGVLVAADFVTVAQDTIASAREHLRVAQARFDAGTTPRFDVLQAETRLAEAEQSLIQARNGLNLARAALNNAMGVPQDQEFDLMTPLAKPPAPVAELPALIAQAQTVRPEVRQAQAQVDAAGAAVDFARADKHPTLALAWVYTRPFETSALQVTNWALSLSAGLTVFNGRQTSAAVSGARHQQESARGLLEQLRQGVALQVRQAYLDLNSAGERIIAAAKGVEQARDAYRIATVRYQSGVGISVEVIDAEVALAAARNAHAQAVYDYSVALAQLEYAVGAERPKVQPVPLPALAPVMNPPPPSGGG